VANYSEKQWAATLFHEGHELHFNKRIGFTSERLEHPNERLLDTARVVASNAIIYMKPNLRFKGIGMMVRVDLRHQLVGYDGA
jgi:hypothetical protein